MTAAQPSQTAGILLFLFIPAVLYLFVRHPEPLWGSLIAGVVLMVGHRRIARPYWLRVREEKCIWCNRWLAAEKAPERFEVRPIRVKRPAEGLTESSDGSFVLFSPRLWARLDERTRADPRAILLRYLVSLAEAERVLRRAVTPARTRRRRATV